MFFFLQDIKALMIYYYNDTVMIWDVNIVIISVLSPWSQMQFLSAKVLWLSDTWKFVYQDVIPSSLFYCLMRCYCIYDIAVLF